MGGAHLDMYCWDEESKEFKGVDYLSVREISGAGGAFSTVLDYAKWVKCLLFETGPFSKEVHRDIKKPRSIASTAPGGGFEISSYSLGWQRTLYKGHVVYMHSGGMHAYGSQVCWLPDAKFGVVAFGNTASTSNAVGDIVASRLIGDRLGIPNEDRFDSDKAWEGRIKATSRSIEDPVKQAFPKRPETTIPSSFKTSELVGSYFDPGYGKITLQEETLSNIPDERILAASRPEMTWKYRLHLQHAFADHWVVVVTLPCNPTLFNECHPGEFKRGADGKVVAFKIEWMTRIAGVSEGKTTFERVLENVPEK